MIKSIGGNVWHVAYDFKIESLATLFYTNNDCVFAVSNKRLGVYWL